MKKFIWKSIVLDTDIILRELNEVSNTSLVNLNPGYLTVFLLSQYPAWEQISRN